MTLPAEIRDLIIEEQQRQAGRFIEGVDLDAYVQKLGDRAELVSEMNGGRCRGFVAFYCNNLNTRRAFISSVLVAPQDRSTGLGRALVTRVLDICRERGFTVCALEVRADNAAALAMYGSLGFIKIDERDGRQLLEHRL